MLRTPDNRIDVPIVVKPFANISPATTSVTTWQTAYPCRQKTPAHYPLFREVMLAEELNKHRHCQTQ